MRDHTKDEVRVIRVGEWRETAAPRVSPLPGIAIEWRQSADGQWHCRQIALAYKEQASDA